MVGSRERLELEVWRGGFEGLRAEPSVKRWAETQRKGGYESRDTSEDKQVSTMEMRDAGANNRCISYIVIYVHFYLCTCKKTIIVAGESWCWTSCICHGYEVTIQAILLQAFHFGQSLYGPCN